METRFVWGLNIALIIGAGALFGACSKSQKVETVPVDTVTVAPPVVDTVTRVPSADSAAMAAMSDANILAAMALADSSELAEGKLVQGRAKSADVKKYATMMVTDHTKMLKDGKDLATKLAITPVPPAGDNTKSESALAMELLGGLTGVSFDSAYIAMAVDDHQKVLDKLSQMRGVAKSPDLQGAIDKAIPVVQRHLQDAQALRAKMMRAIPAAADTAKKM